MPSFTRRLVLCTTLLAPPALAGQRPVADTLARPLHAAERYLDAALAPRARDDRRTLGWLPVAWYSDHGGMTVALRLRSTYRNLADRHQLLLGWSTGLASPEDRTAKTLQASLTLHNPLATWHPGLDQRLHLFRLDGRSGVAVSVSHRERIGASLRWLAVQDAHYLDSLTWNVGGTVELPVWVERESVIGGWRLLSRATVTGAVEYRRPGDGITTRHRYDMQPWARMNVEVTAHRAISGAVALGLRANHAAVFSADPVLPQRRLFVAGADPYEQLANPFLRSVGAPLVRGGMAGHWHAPGGGNLRGFDGAISTDRLTALNVEVVATLLSPAPKLLSRIAVVGFGDVARLGAARGIGGDSDALILRPALRRTLLDAGVGLRMTHRLGGVTFESRMELPFYVNESHWAASGRQERVSARRWLIGLAPVIR